MQAKLTKKEFIEWLKLLRENNLISTFGMHFNALIMLMLVGKLCLDYIKGVGAKDIPFANNFDGLATVCRETHRTS